MDVEIRHLRSFVAVAEERNFTRAAERLHLAQPALSVQIRQLEERMGVRLVERTTRRVALTPAGEALLERARALLDGVASAVQQVQDTAAGRTGRLRVGLGATASLDLAPVALRAFAAAVPNADISVHDVPVRRSVRRRARPDHERCDRVDPAGRDGARSGNPSRTSPAESSCRATTAWPMRGASRSTTC